MVTFGDHPLKYIEFVPWKQLEPFHLQETSEYSQKSATDVVETCEASGLGKAPLHGGWHFWNVCSVWHSISGVFFRRPCHFRDQSNFDLRTRYR